MAPLAESLHAGTKDKVIAKETADAVRFLEAMDDAPDEASSLPLLPNVYSVERSQ